MGEIFEVLLRLIAFAVVLGPANRGLFWLIVGSPLAGARLAYASRSEREQARGLQPKKSPVCDQQTPKREAEAISRSFTLMISPIGEILSAVLSPACCLHDLQQRREVLLAGAAVDEVVKFFRFF